MDVRREDRRARARPPRAAAPPASRSRRGDGSRRLRGGRRARARRRRPGAAARAPHARRRASAPGRRRPSRGAHQRDARLDRAAASGRPRRVATPRAQRSTRWPWPRTSSHPAAVSASRGSRAIWASLNRLSQPLHRAALARRRPGRRRWPRPGRRRRARLRRPARGARPDRRPRRARCQALARRCSVGLELRLALPELGPQRVADQPVIAVPLAGPVDGEHEALAGQRLEDARPSRRRSSSASQSGPVSVSTTTCGRRTTSRVVRQVAQHLVAHVVRDEAVGAAEAREVRAAAAVAEIQRGQRQRHRPALGALEQRSSVSGSSRWPASARSLARLRPGHREVARADLGHEPLRAHPRDRQRELAGARPRRAWRAAAGRPRSPPARRARRGVQSACASSTTSTNARVRRRREGRVDGARPPTSRSRSAVVVALVDRHPRERAGVALLPFAQQRRLPVSGRGDEHGERRRRRVREPLHQRGPADDGAAPLRASAPQPERGAGRDSATAAEVMGRASPHAGGARQGRAPARRGSAGTRPLGDGVGRCSRPLHPHLTMRSRRPARLRSPASPIDDPAPHSERDRRRGSRGGRLRVRLSAGADEPHQGLDDRRRRSPTRHGCARP